MNKKSTNFIKEKINEIYLSDRILRENGLLGLNFLKNIESNIYDFINKNKIKLIIGEFTWGHELITFRIIKNNKLNCKYLNIPRLLEYLTQDQVFTEEDQKILINLYNKKDNKKFDQKNIILKLKKDQKNVNLILKKVLKFLIKNFFHEEDIFYIPKLKKIITNIEYIKNIFIL